MTPDDWPRVRAIYEAGIATGNATFETDAPTWEAWDRGHLAAPRLVAGRGGDVLAWAALSPVSDRCVYEGVAEVSVYVERGRSRTGAGRALYAALLDRLAGRGFRTAVAGMTVPNAASEGLHLAMGFEPVGIQASFTRR